MSVESLSPPTAEPGGAAPARITMLLVPLMLVLFISNLDQTIVATALPSIGRDLGDLSGTSWVATGYLLTSAITTLIFGTLGDMYGRKRIFQIAIVLFLVGSALCGAARDLTWLILFRAFQGIGGGGLNSLVMAVIGDVVPPRQRSKYQASVGIVATLALIAGPLLGGLFSETLSWRWIFYINLPIGVLALVIVALRLRLPRPAAGARGRIDVAGGLLAAVFTSAVMLFTTWGGSRYAWGSAPVLTLVVVSVLSLAGYLLVERRAAEPITPLHLFRSGVFVIAAAQFLLATLVLFVAMLYVPLFLQTVQHRSAFTAGLFVIPLLVGLVAATAVAGPFISRTGRYKVYPVIGAVLTAAGMYMVSLAGQHTAAWQLVVPLAVAGAGLGFFVQVALLAGQNAVEHRHLGVATGALNFFKSIGGAFGAALFGAILTTGLAHVPPGATAGHVQAFHTVFRWTLPFMALSFVLALVMREKPLSDEMKDVVHGKIEVPEY
ncbi:MDR family MFS transporter [Streptantibioticus silvisoli]|uniref:MDR family MFS transporter n=1 Tax=Streptantibioticus silvisoli TaxID=2705255 RepID=A0ABT6W9I0_9ACTN|nr:MDR family MFS transporter [Streptantibioticus silvisoli]MDI5967030.1 MDR family MFS transporter [Streptantibioticus silvisoli]